MALITKNFTQFFQDLENNNNKEWFHSQKTVYDNHVKGPFLHVLETLLPHLKALDNEITMTPKEGLFRINRDVRFSKDKSPYQTTMKAGFAKGGRKSPFAGYYLGISKSHIHVGGGVFMVPTNELTKIRTHLHHNPEEFKSLIKAPNFISKFKQVQGERLKRVPEPYKGIASDIPEVANKQFYYMAQLPVDAVLYADDLIETLVQHFNTITPLNQFLKRAIV